MGRRPAVDKFPIEIRDLFYRLVREGKTIVEITEKLHELDTEVSQSAVGRSVKSARQQLKLWQSAQEVAGQWVTGASENPQGDVGMLCTQMLQSLAYQTLGQMAELQAEGDGSGKAAKPIKSMDLMLLAKTIKDLEATTKQNIERRQKIEQAALERQAKAAEKVAKKSGMSKQAWEAIRAEFLGIKDQVE